MRPLLLATAIPAAGACYSGGDPVFEKRSSLFHRSGGVPAGAPGDGQPARFARPTFARKRTKWPVLLAIAGLALSLASPARSQECDERDGLLVSGWQGLFLNNQQAADPGFCGPVYGVPTMMGTHESFFATPVQITSFAPTPVFATYTGATAAFTNINQPVVFSFQSGNPSLLPNIGAAPSVPPAVDRSGDGLPGTFRGLPEVAGVSQRLRANAPLPGTITFVRGQAVFVSNTSLLFQSQTIGADPSVLLPEVDGSVAAAEAADPNFNGYQLQYFYQFTRDPISLVLPHPTSTSLTGRTKIAQNGSVVPRTRVFLDYDVLGYDDLTADGFTFHRFTPGLERTFFGGMTSLELRVPIALTANASIAADDPVNEGNSEFGNVSLAVKGLMIRTPQFAFSGGLQVTLPTADDTTVTLGDGTRLLEVENESFHVLPFLGAVYDAPLFYTQMFAQLDIDVNGNSMRANPSLTPGAALVEAPDLYDDDRLYLDWATGLWLYRAPNGPRGPMDLVAFAPTVELHYTQGIDKVDAVRVGSLQVGEDTDPVQRLDVVLGASAVLQGGTLSAGVGIPASGDQTHDWEFRLLLNHALR